MSWKHGTMPLSYPATKSMQCISLKHIREIQSALLETVIENCALSVSPHGKRNNTWTEGNSNERRYLERFPRYIQK